MLEHLSIYPVLALDCGREQWQSGWCRQSAGKTVGQVQRAPERPTRRQNPQRPYVRRSLAGAKRWSDLYSDMES